MLTVAEVGRSARKYSEALLGVVVLTVIMLVEAAVMVVVELDN